MADITDLQIPNQELDFDFEDPIETDSVEASDIVEDPEEKIGREELKYNTLIENGFSDQDAKWYLREDKKRTLVDNGFSDKDADWYLDEKEYQNYVEKEDANIPIYSDAKNAISDAVNYTADFLPYVDTGEQSEDDLRFRDRASEEARLSARQFLDDNLPTVVPNVVKDAIAESGSALASVGGGVGLALSLPVVLPATLSAGGVATISLLGSAALGGLQSAGSEYYSSRRQGLSDSEAEMRAGISGLSSAVIGFLGGKTVKGAGEMVLNGVKRTALNSGAVASSNYINKLIQGKAAQRGVELTGDALTELAEEMVQAYLLDGKTLSLRDAMKIIITSGGLNLGLSATTHAYDLSRGRVKEKSDTRNNILRKYEDNLLSGKKQYTGDGKSAETLAKANSFLNSITRPMTDQELEFSKEKGMEESEFQALLENEAANNMSFGSYLLAKTMGLDITSADIQENGKAFAEVYSKTMNEVNRGRVVTHENLMRDYNNFMEKNNIVEDNAKYQTESKKLSDLESEVAIDQNNLEEIENIQVAKEVNNELNDKKFVEEVDEKIEAKKTEAEETKKDIKASEKVVKESEKLISETEKKSDELSDKFSKLKRSEALRDTEVSKKVDDIEKTLEKISETEARVKKGEKDLPELKKNLDLNDKLNSEISKLKGSKNLDTKKSRLLRKKKNRLKQVEKKIDELSSDSVFAATSEGKKEIGSLKNEIKVYEKEIEVLQKAGKPSDAISSDLNSANLQLDLYRKAHKDSKKDLSDLETKLAEVEKDITDLESSKDMETRKAPMEEAKKEFKSVKDSLVKTIKEKRQAIRDQEVKLKNLEYSMQNTVDKRVNKIKESSELLQNDADYKQAQEYEKQNPSKGKRAKISEDIFNSPNLEISPDLDKEAFVKSHNATVDLFNTADFNFIDTLGDKNVTVDEAFSMVRSMLYSASKKASENGKVWNQDVKSVGDFFRKIKVNYLFSDSGDGFEKLNSLFRIDPLDPLRNPPSRKQEIPQQKTDSKDDGKFTKMLKDEVKKQNESKPKIFTPPNKLKSSIDGEILGQVVNDTESKNILINLFSGSDISTVFHETSHILEKALGGSKELEKIRKIINPDVKDTKSPWTEAESEAFVEWFMKESGNVKNILDDNSFFGKITRILYSASKFAPIVGKKNSLTYHFVKDAVFGLENRVKLRKYKTFKRSLWSRLYKDEMSDRSQVLLDMLDPETRKLDPSFNPHSNFRQILGSSGRKYAFNLYGVEDPFTTFYEGDKIIGQHRSSVKKNAPDSLIRDMVPISNEIARLYIEKGLTPPKFSYDLNSPADRKLSVDKFSISQLAYLMYSENSVIDNKRVLKEKAQKILAKNNVDENIQKELWKLVDGYDNYVSKLNNYALNAGIFHSKRKSASHLDAKLLDAVSEGKTFDRGLGIFERMSVLAESVVDVADRNRLLSSILNPFNTNSQAFNIDEVTFDPSIARKLTNAEISTLSKSDLKRVRTMFGYKIGEKPVKYKKGDKVVTDFEKYAYASQVNFMLTKDYDRLFKSLSPDESFMGDILNVFGKFNNIGKTIITHNPAFILTNPSKDLFSALGNTRSSKTGFLAEIPESMKEFKDDVKGMSKTTYDRTIRGGGIVDIGGERQTYSNALSEAILEFNKDSKTHVINSKEDLKNVFDTLSGNILSKFEKAVQASESLTRNTEYRNAYKTLKKKHPNVDDKILKLLATHEANDLIDYSKMGYQIMKLNKVLMFSGAATRSMNRVFEGFSDMEGSKVNVKSFLEKLPKHAMAVLGAFVIPKLVLRALQGEEEEQELPNYYRDFGTYINFKKITNGLIDFNIFIPQGYEHSVIASTILRSLDKLRGSDPEAYNGLLESLKTSFLAFDAENPNVYPFNMLFNLARNYDPFFKDSIYGKGKRFDKASPLSQGISEKLDKLVDPNAIDYALKGSLFYYGKQITNLSKPTDSRFNRTFSDFTGLSKVVSPYTYKSVRSILDNKDKYGSGDLEELNMVLSKWYNDKSEKNRLTLIRTARKIVKRTK